MSASYIADLSGFFAPFAWRLAGPSMKRSSETPFIRKSEFKRHLKDRGTTRRAKSLLCDVSAKVVDNLFEAGAFRHQSSLQRPLGQSELT